MTTDAVETLAVARTVAALREHVAAYRRRGESVGLVPTMGALHAGHLALVEAARRQCDRVVATLFVNPKQFDRPDDLTHYPRDEGRDARLLDEAGADLLFAPSGAEMYPDGFATTVCVGGVTDSLEGAHRPGHFDGVTTVVTKLLLQSLPDRAFFGEKDYQQLVTVRRLARDLDIPVTIEGVPIVREGDGLALSSRNQRLTADQRAVAPTLARVLRDSAARLADGTADADAVLDGGRRTLLNAGFDAVDYLALCDARDLTPLARADRPARLLAAAWLGPVRLIDNIAVGDAG
ncbi:pantothenate synthetase [Limimonas halophila]|uniref:Pantothenate synthetase n=1 Tax=Limimonas halophila TaxID=1082479 RepID=A0A1G7TFX4_9PROT|nr:pantoate--beta-alanine ligase [Limimonas halophila]SDG33460.1 pantothenate synthetase [Limimonas halophila]